MSFFKFLFRTILSILVIVIIAIFIVGYLYYTPPPPPSTVVFDIPVLVYKNIDEVRLVLGKPDSDEPNSKDKSITDWTNTYYKNDFKLHIDFNPNTRAISQYMIVTDNGSSYEKVEDMLRIGNVRSSNATYTIETAPLERNDFSYVIIKINK